MKKWFVTSVGAVALLAFAATGFAETPGDVLSSTASEVQVYYKEWTDFDPENKNKTDLLDGVEWQDLGLGNTSAPGRSWNSLPVDSDGLSNVESHSFTFVNHASVAQWIKWSTTGTRKDWRIRRPGQYASDSIHFTILSNNDVNVSFSEFNDLEYHDMSLVPADTQGTIETWYSYGGTVGAAEENGWIRAEQLNGNPLFQFVNTDPLHYGQQYKIWSKIQVEPSNNSSDYEDEGVVTLTLTNMKHWVDSETGVFVQDQLNSGKVN